MLEGRPYVRWWWLSGPFLKPDISHQLRWIAAQGFGGIELAWIHPGWLEEPERSAPRPPLLSPEWTELVAFTKQEATALELHCDFTFGSAWPFGGSWVTPAHGAQTFAGLSGELLRGSWEISASEPVRVINHLSAAALGHYAQPLLAALQPALAGETSCLFCDSLEIATDRLWSRDLFAAFSDQFGYALEPFIDTLDAHPQVRFDYRKLRGAALQRNFYEAFTSLCHQAGALSRVQCHGAPADLLAAYASVDVPESESLLFPPAFSRIAASAAAWAGKPVVSAEAFTCLHGFPGWDDSAEELWRQETPGDLKLLADALFANGINQLVWHGMPYRPAGGEQEFYASVHVGPDSKFSPQLPALNNYFAQVCQLLQSGKPLAGLGLYLPWEDAWMLDRISPTKRTPGANFHWEMRHARQAPLWQGFAPVWISLPFLQEAEVVEGGAIRSRHLTVNTLVINSKWLDADSLDELTRLSAQGACIVFSRTPKQPGHKKSNRFKKQLKSVPVPTCTAQPLLTGENLPTFTARQIDRDLLLFFAHPATDCIRYPLPHRLSDQARPETRALTVQWNGNSVAIQLSFGHNDSLAMLVSASGRVQPQPLPSHNEICARP